MAARLEVLTRRLWTAGQRKTVSPLPERVPRMIDFLIGLAFVAMVVLPAVIGYVQNNKSHQDDL